MKAHLSPRLRFLLLALAAAILFLGVIRLGDLAGYDDALYSLQAKGSRLPAIGCRRKFAGFHRWSILRSSCGRRRSS